MLTKLLIRNYAIIDELSVNFSEHLNVITGETGAGKSIIMGALSLILGERAETNALKNKEEKCIIEGYFNPKNINHVIAFIQENDLDENTNEIILRREIAPNGKSRAFINDTPVNLQQLKSISSLLVDLHQQFDTLELNDNHFQREVLDALAGNASLLSQYQNAYHQYAQVQKELNELVQQQKEASATLDYNQFLFNELEEANLAENELENLEQELKTLNNAENIKQQLNACFYELKESEQPLLQQLKTISNKLSGIQQFHNNIPAILERLQSSYIELQDIASEIEQVNDSVHYDAERIQTISDKISIGYKLLKKHNVQTTNELLTIKTDLESKLNDITNLSDVITKKETELNKLFTQCNTLAKELSSNRKSIVSLFIENTNQLLTQVGMPNAQIQVEVTDANLHVYGSDHISLLFNANVPAGNKAIVFEPISKVASGGELSRLMLCIKYLVAQKLQMPTLIFDEIDTGISGEAAKQVGLIMKTLSQKHQVITITHQAQIAAKASAHYFVYKSVSQNSITTSIKQLSNNDRITAIAQMLSGEKPTAAALENAKEMIE